MKPCSFRLGVVCRLTIAAGLLVSSTSRGQDNSLQDIPYQPSASVVKGTEAALSDSSIEVVAAAVRALADWREVSVATNVAKLLTPETSPMVRLEALRYFTRLGPKSKPYLDSVLKQSKDSDPNIRAATLGVVFDAQASAEHLEAIRQLLDDPRSDVRCAAARCMGQAGRSAGPERKALLAALKGAGTDDFKTALLRALAQIGGLTVEDIEQIKPQMRSREGEVRIAAWLTFLKAMAAAKSTGGVTEDQFAATRTEYLPLFEAEPSEVKAAIIAGMRGDKTALQTFVQGLVRNVRAGTPEVKAAALRGLGEAGDAALDQVPLIIKESKNQDSGVRAAAIAALGSLGPAAVKPNMPVVANALLDESDLVRDEALRALPAGGDAVGTFPYRIRDVYPKVSPGVRETLIRAEPIRVRIIGMDDETAARGRSALADPNPDIRIGMAYVMGQLGNKFGAVMLPQLLPLVRDPEPAVRGAAIISLRAFATDTTAKRKFRDVLRPLLKDQDAQVRWAALDMFHELDPGQDSKLVDDIAALLKDEDRAVRSAAVRALGAAGPAAKAHLLEIVQFFLDDPAVPPYAAAEAVLRVSPLTAQELTALLYPLYLNPELTTVVRATAYAASGGEPDGLLIVRLLGRTRDSAPDVVAKTATEHATILLEDAIKAPLLHDQLKAEIEARLAEIKAIR